MRRLTIASLDTLRRVITSDPVNTLVDRFGLASFLSEWYWWLVYRASRGVCHQHIRDAEVAFHASSPHEFQHYRTLVNEKVVVTDLLSRLDADDPFWDVGAYIGAYTCLVAARDGTGPVTSFEPHGPWADRIETNLVTNGLAAEVRRIALAHETGESCLGLDNVARLVEARGSQRDASDDPVVRTITGDRYIRSQDARIPAALKIDVEGAERRVLEGMHETLGNPECRLVYCEVHPSLLPEFDDSEDDVTEFLTEHGFRVDRIHDRGSEYFLRGVKLDHD